MEEGTDNNNPNRENHSARAFGADVPIAIVGLSCKFPGEASSPEEFWELLENGRSAWTSDAGFRFNMAAHHHPKRDQNGSFNPIGAHFIKQNLAEFDAPFFSISATEAKAMDPQQRHTLESVYEAIESAGITMSSLAGSKTAVFANTYNRDWFSIVLRDPEAIPKYQALGTGDALISNRVSYFFDLRGPSMTLDTGSSGSMVALHQACQSIRCGESSQAIVSAANLILDPELLVGMSNLGFLSDNGRCLTFDSRGNGYGRGEGVASIFLKPLDAALRDGNPIRSIIRGTFANQDGRTPGITMPSTKAQIDMIRGAYHNADLEMSLTAYCESHGTGTPAGDPVEAEAIGSTLAKFHSKKDPLIVGSVKTNIGHLESCASMAGLIKVTLMLEKGVIVPNHDFQSPNPKIHLDEWHMMIPTKTIKWPNSTYKRASVNAFGYGGTNCHAILDAADSYLTLLGHKSVPRTLCSEETCLSLDLQNGSVISDDLTKPPVSPSYRLFVLSARNEKVLLRMIQNLASYVKKCSKSEADVLDSLSYTLCLRRTHLPRRIAFVASSLQELIQALEAANFSTRAILMSPEDRLGFCFTGQGAQWPRMGRELFQHYSVFQSSLMRADAYLASFGASWSLTEELLKDGQKSLVYQAEYSQPICTAVQIALTDLLSSWGVRPAAVTGHSSGEIAAAYACGVLSARDAMLVAYFRGLCATQATKRNPCLGAMLVTNASESQVEEYITAMPIKMGKAVVACINSPSSVTISGDESAIDYLQEALDSSSQFTRKLDVDTAYHSHHMETIETEYYETLRDINPQESNVPFFSSVYGRSLQGSQLDPEYWVKNLLSQVKFSAAIMAMCSYHMEITPDLDGPFISTIVEIGPHSALGGAIQQTIRSSKIAANVEYTPSLIRKEDGTKTILTLAGALFMQNYPLNLDVLTKSRNHVSNFVTLSDLPAYPWDHSTTYWAESRLSSDYRLRSRPRHQLLGVPSMDWNHLEPSWRHILRPNELPWIRGHSLGGQIIYPAAGYIAVVLQACLEQQIYQRNDGGKEISLFKLKGVNISKALVVPDDSDGIEMVTKLRPYRVSEHENSSSWQEFLICSYSNNGTWSQHCQGLVSVQFEKDYTLENIMTNDVDPCQTKDFLGFYEKLTDLGYQFSPPFKNVQNVRTGYHEAFASIKVPDTSEHMTEGYELPQMLHPATLDSVFQVPLAALDASGSLLSAMVPVHCDMITIAGDILHVHGEELRARSKTTSDGPRKCKVHASVTNAGGATQILIEGLSYTALNSTAVMDDQGSMGQICHKVHYIEDIDKLMDGALKKMTMSKLSQPKPSTHFELIHATCLILMERALETLRDKQISEGSAEHHRFLYDWMQASVADAGSIRSLANDDNFQARVESLGSTGLMVYRVGSNLSRIILGEVEPLELMTTGGLLDEFYQEDSIRRCYSTMQTYVGLLRQKDPNMKVIEIGAGTGGATQAVLESLDGQFSQYDFTDISAGFFEKAHKKFSQWGSAIVYKKLNIEKDPMEQAFDEGSYDLVIASNVLHATRSIHETMLNVHKLLKPNGRLLLLEIPKPMLYIQMIFGTLPGWWMGREEGRVVSPCLDIPQWHSVLQETGFSGVDSHIPDYEAEEFAQYEVITSKVRPETSECLTYGVQIITSPESSRVVDELSESLCSILGDGVAHKTTLAECEPHGKICVFLSEMVQPLFYSCDKTQFDQLKIILAHAAGIIWLTNHDPKNALVTGLARTARSENSGMRFITLKTDPDSISCSATGDTIRGFCEDISRGQNADYDSEYIEHNGRLLIPRLINDEDTAGYLTGSATRPEQEEDFDPARSNLTLEVALPGKLDSVQWHEQQTFNAGPAADEVFVEVRAFGLNFRDLMIALGQFGNASLMTGECSGFIKAVGSDIQDSFKVGDRVCGWSATGFSSIARMKGAGVHRLDDLTSFEEGASLVVAYTTAYYALINLAHLQKGEKVLIHSAAGAVGQVAIMLAQYVGAEIFVTVGNDEKASFLQKEYHIMPDRIFSSRSTGLLARLQEATGGCGIDVVLNSLTGDIARESHACLATFGRFVEIGIQNFLQNSRMDTSFMQQNISFFSVDMTKVLKQNPRLFAQLLSSVFRLRESGALKSIHPITQFEPSELESAFRTLQTGKHIGKVVINSRQGSRVKVVPRPVPAVQFAGNISYMISGGLGGLGRAFVKWMCQSGARNIVILTRYGLRGAVLEAWAAEVREMGVKLAVYICDIVNEDSLKIAIQQASEEMPPIRGVIQAAMVLKDCLLENMSHAEYFDAIEPKTIGSQNLHQAFLSQPLDFFIMLSSAAGIVGNTGQANYASGCTFQDALARHRIKLGLRAHSIDLGMIQSAGYVAENPEAVQFLREQGYVPVELDQVFRMINKVIQEPATESQDGQTVLGLRYDQSTNNGAVMQHLLDPKFRHLLSSRRTSGNSVAIQEQDISKSIAAAKSLPEAITVIADALASRLRRLLAIESEEISHSQSISDLGTDSLVAVELKSWVSREMHVNVQVLEILQSTSIKSFAATLAARSKLAMEAIEQGQEQKET
ncbi:Type I Polyketide synthases (Type I PKS) [Penicillium frequentans]|uniref:Type I Polyketide synthases (Type I PKS) n=1 Tax=Penicillium frequentans TaxID=3151616 RepID=A0AAD6GM15_9EURO|nr:Type I Polyketide synthases (Type I PKS) [Penicillium glabrum]